MTEKRCLTFDAVGGRFAPVIREVPADLDTPLSCYLKLAQGRYSGRSSLATTSEW